MHAPITEYLHQKLTEIGTPGFEKLAADTGVKVSFIRKFFYGGRKDPRVMTIQPLLDYFRAQELLSQEATAPGSDAASPQLPNTETNHG